MLLASVFLLFSCRQEALNLENDHSHNETQRFISFNKFSRLTNVEGRSFFHSVNTKGDSDLDDYDIDTTHIKYRDPKWEYFL